MRRLPRVDTLGAVGAVAGVLAVCVLVACGTDGKTLREPVFDMPATTTTFTTETTTEITPVDPTTTLVELTLPTLPLTEPPAVTDPSRSIVIDELFSPQNATAEARGRGALPTDPVTVDGAPADVIAFDADETGAFVLRVWIEDEGAHTVCVAATCGRVFTLDPDADSPEEVVAKIDEAIAVFERDYDVAAQVPGWSIEVGGALAGTGGSTDEETRTISVYRNRGRTVDDFVRTILHEYGHAADADRLDDAERAEYVRIRGIDPTRAWRDEGAHRIGDWERQPSEDFAEVMVMIWSDGRWTPRTEVLAPTPDADQLAAVAALVAD